MNKGLDTAFVHYGIRQSDLDLLETLAQSRGLDFTWIQEEILKVFHEHKARDTDLDETALRKIVEKAINKWEP